MADESSGGGLGAIILFFIVVAIFSGTFRGCINAASEEDLEKLKDRIDILEEKIKVVKKDVSKEVEIKFYELKEKEDGSVQIIESEIPEKPMTEKEKLESEQERLQEEIDNWNKKY